MVSILKEMTNEKRVIVKILAILLIFALTFTNFALLGKYFGEGVSYALGINLNYQDSKTNVENVKFDVYLDNGNRNTKTMEKDINSDDLILYVYVSVEGGGVLKDGKISFGDTNFNITQETDNKLALDNIQSGQSAIIEIPIEALKVGNKYNLGLLTMLSGIKLTGKYTNNDGIVVDINAEKYVQVIWNSSNFSEENNPIILEQEIITNKIFEIDGENKRVVQILVKSGIESNIYPIKETNIEVNVLEGTTPEEAHVSVINGSIVTNDWEYDTENDKINIKSRNLPDNNNNVAWDQSELNEYIITYVYSEGTDISGAQSDMTSSILLYGDSGFDLNASASMIVEDMAEVSNITSFDMSITNQVYKSNLKIEENIEYETKWSIGISYAPVVDSIIVEDNKDALSNEETNLYNRSIYKTSTINKKEFLRLFGEDGKIEIYNKATSELLYIVDKNQETDEKGNVVVEYPEDIYDIYIKTSRPIEEGKLEINTTKNIIAGLTDEELANIDRLVSTSVLAANKEVNKVEERQAEAIMQIEAPVTVSRLGLSRTALSSVQANEVVLTVTLKTDDLKYDLYTNPIFEIEIPSYVKILNVTNIQLLNGNGLELLPFEGVQTNAYGNKVIRVGLTGEQITYGADAKIAINTKMMTEEFMPSIETEIKLTYINGKETKYADETNTDTVGITIQSQPGMILGHSVSNYAGIGMSLNAIRSGTKTGRLEINASTRTATFKGTIINNIGSTADNATILGRIPVKGNTEIVSGEDLGTTIDTQLKSSINIVNKNGNVVDGTVYYSDKEDATADLEDSANGWTTVAVASAKSYLIAVNSIEDKETLEFTYDVEIPANLEKNQELYTVYAIYNGSSLTEAPLLKLETVKEIDSKVRIETTSSARNGVMHEGERVTYSVQIINESDTDIEDVTITLPIPEGTTYIKRERKAGENTGYFVYNEYPEQKEITVNASSIKAGETKDLDTYMVKVDKLQDGKEEIDIEHVVLMTVYGLENGLEKTNTYTAKQAKFSSEMAWPHYGGNVFVGEGTYYCAVIQNVSNKEMTNIEFTAIIPEGLKYTDIYIDKQEGTDFEVVKNAANYNKNNRTLTCKIDSLAPDGEITVAIFVEGEALKEGQNTNRILCEGTVKADGIETHNLSSVTFDIVNLSIEITDSSNVEDKTVFEKEVLKHKITITNTSSRQLENVSIELDFPEETMYMDSAPFNTQPQDNKMTWGESVFLPGQTIEYELSVYTDSLADGLKSAPLDFEARVSALNLNNDINHSTRYILASNSPDNPTNPTTYKISGVAWLDGNGNGKKDDGEQLLKDIGVKLRNTDTNQLVKDAQGKDLLVKTDNNGKYSFENIKIGNYMVIFEFDHSKYKVTAANAEGVPTAQSSKATTTVIDGKPTTHTDRIQITNRDVENINLGLTENQNFDLGIEKYVSKVTLQNQDGTETHTYNKQNGKLAKADVRARYLAGTMVIIEYTLEVTNHGDVPGYAKTIVDHMSPELKFNSEMNANWYEGPDSILYTNALANEVIEPGKSKTLKLTLTKTMTSNNTGLTNNTAEIIERYNEQALEDLNKSNDKSSADVIVTIRTGSPAMYISIIIACMLILGGGIYIINKKVLVAGRRGA